ncbi:transposase family protein [Trinickia mobilis]|uniref:transposase family protein n=1 Tax=Trinickia mobilis TaxID=2816356 RepID=UPI001A8E550D|nr:transposase family protein [Trinickia mobilis]
MADHKFELPFWEGFTVAKSQREPGATRITLVPHEKQAAYCSGCGSSSERVHEHGWRTIRDLPILGDAVWLRVRLRRVRCVACGPRTERVSWIGRHARIIKKI